MKKDLEVRKFDFVAKNQFVFRLFNLLRVIMQGKLIAVAYTQDKSI